MYPRENVPFVRTFFSFLGTPGETWHSVSKGTYSQWDFVPAVLEMVAPATLDCLAIVTLSFSKSNLEQLLALIDVDADDGRRLLHHRIIGKP